MYLRIVTEPQVIIPCVGGIVQRRHLHRQYSGFIRLSRRARQKIQNFGYWSTEHMSHLSCHKNARVQLYNECLLFTNQHLPCSGSLAGSSQVTVFMNIVQKPSSAGKRLFRFQRNGSFHRCKGGDTGSTCASRDIGDKVKG